MSSGSLNNYCQYIFSNANPVKNLIFLNVDKTLKTVQISKSIVVLLAKSCICIHNKRIFNFTYSESFVMMIIVCFSLNIDGSKHSEKRNVRHASHRLWLAAGIVFILLLPGIPKLIGSRPCRSLTDLFRALCRCSFLHVTQTPHMLSCFDFVLGEGKWREWTLHCLVLDRRNK